MLHNLRDMHSDVEWVELADDVSSARRMWRPTRNNSTLQVTRKYSVRACVNEWGHCRALRRAAPCRAVPCRATPPTTRVLCIQHRGSNRNTPSHFLPMSPSTPCYGPHRHHWSLLSLWPPVVAHATPSGAWIWKLVFLSSSYISFS
jgi:hypothetical protein